jgi:hypothetical protein
MEQPSFAVRLAGGQTEPLALRSEAGRIVASVCPVGLNRRAVVRWLERHQIPLLTDRVEPPGTPLAVPLVRLATLVVCLDSRIRDVAVLYAASVGATLCHLRTPEEVFTAVENSASQESVSLFLLSDRLEEAICNAVAAANQRRRAAGRAVLPYGFLSAFTPEQLAWLVVKSWALLLRSCVESTGFAQWDFSAPESVARFRSTETGATRVFHIDTPWVSDSITALGLRAHGAPFDAAMGQAVLCGHLDPPLPRERTLRAPSCFHDGVCFRMKPTQNAPTELLPAVDASPLVWYLDSCASIPLTGNAFGEGTSYAFGLVAGAAVGVIGPFLDVVTRGAMSRHCEALLATGATLGQIAGAACRLEPSREFDKYLLIGSPDLRLLPPNRQEGRREGGVLRYFLRGERQYAWRLAIPPDLGLPVYVVGDDGSTHWAGARCEWFEQGAERDLVVTLDEPADVDGWLLVGTGERSNDQIGEEALQIQDNLKVLALYAFVDPEAGAISRCRRVARLLRRVTRVPDRLRSRVEVAVLLTHLQSALETLHREIADCFLAYVGAHDFNLDRISAIGFDLKPTERTGERCPNCGAALYLTQASWRKKRSYVRRWVQCANCSGLSLALADSPLEIHPPVAIPSPDGASLSIALCIHNRTTAPVQALIAGLARQGSPADAAGPVLALFPANSLERVHFSSPLRPSRPGVISYRLLVLCRAGAEFFALKYVLEPAAREAPSPCGAVGERLLTRVGVVPSP